MVDGPVSSRRFSRRRIRSVLIAGAALAAVLVTAYGALHFYDRSSESVAEKRQKQLEDFAAQQAQHVATLFAGIDRQLAELAGEAGLHKLFTEANEEALESAAAKRVGSFESGLKLRYLLSGKYALDNDSVPPLSYGSLDMLKRAESSSEAIGAEAHMLGSPKEHIVMLKRVSDAAGNLLGFIHLSLGVDLLEKALTGLSFRDGYLELQQGKGTQALALGKYGMPELRKGQPYTMPVAGTRWDVALWTRGVAPAEAGSVDTGLILPVLLVLLVVGVIVVFMLRRGNGEDKDSTEVVYAGAVRAIMDGAHPGMAKMVPHLPKSDRSGVAEVSISQGAVGDDITRIAKVPEIKADEIGAEDKKAAAEQSEIFDLFQADEPAAPAAPPKKPASASPAGAVSAEIFRAYDIRGIVGKTLTEQTVTKIGQAIGSEAATRGQATLVVGRDGRKSSPQLAAALIHGLQSAGRNVIDVGMVPTPLLYFATHLLETKSGVMLTGSHNGPEYNGLKIVLDGETLSEDGIKAIHTRISEGRFETGQGTLETQEITADYVRRVSEDIPVALGNSYRIVVDCGNGVAGAVAPQLLRALGHDVVELFCDIDGSFPNHHPDPSQPGNLEALIAKVREEKANIGFAFDGDGDRLGVVDDLGNIIWPDRQLMLLAKDVLSRNQGKTIIYDVKCSRHLKTIIESSGGKALMWKTGHSLIKRKMKEMDAPLAGEMSGHIFFKERWYGFDDAIYTAARLLEVLMGTKAAASVTFAGLPQTVSTPELRIKLAESAHSGFMQELRGKMVFDGAQVIDIDGYRVEFADGWGLIRPSNTSPYLVLRFEADSDEALSRIQNEFRTVLSATNPDLKLPF